MNINTLSPDVLLEAKRAEFNKRLSALLEELELELTINLVINERKKPMSDDQVVAPDATEAELASATPAESTDESASEVPSEQPAAEEPVAEPKQAV